MGSIGRVRIRRRSVPAWLLGPLMLAATVCGALVVLRGPDRVFAAALTALFGAAAAWFLTSVLWPARADRTCPSCGTRSLHRLDRRSTRGVACAACGHEDAEQSSFLLVEDEGVPIEPIVIAERTRGVIAERTRGVIGERARGRGVRR